jgi:RNA polymerase sigma factor (sigma-70 family)
MDRFEFDDLYVRRLKEHDRDTEAHFDQYFRRRLFAKVHGHRIPIHEMDDVIQDVFVRVFSGLDKLRESSKLPAFVLGVCNNVVQERLREEERRRRTEPLDEVHEATIVDDELNPETKLLIAENAAIVHQILKDMRDPRDADILRAMLLDEEDGDEVCRRFDITPEYRRVLLHRAIQKFRAAYLRRPRH